MEIYLRDLQESDALISYKWRNNPNIWKLTWSKPDRTITYEIENEWILEVLKRNDEKRFAICVSWTDQYIWNVQLTHIDHWQAEFHIFIWEEPFWGIWIGTKATKAMIDIAFNKLWLDSIYLFVRNENVWAIKSYQNAWFSVSLSEWVLVKMIVAKP